MSVVLALPCGPHKIRITRGISGSSHFGPYQLGLVIWIMDTYSVLTIVYAIEGLYAIKPLKRALDRVQTNAGLGSIFFRLFGSSFF